jgi:hypothetical protein
VPSSATDDAARARWARFNATAPVGRVEAAASARTATVQAPVATTPAHDQIIAVELADESTGAIWYWQERSGIGKRAVEKLMPIG